MMQDYKKIFYLMILLSSCSGMKYKAEVYKLNSGPTNNVKSVEEIRFERSMDLRQNLKIAELQIRSSENAQRGRALMMDAEFIIQSEDLTTGPYLESLLSTLKQKNSALFVYCDTLIKCQSAQLDLIKKGLNLQRYVVFPRKGPSFQFELDRWLQKYPRPVILSKSQNDIALLLNSYFKKKNLSKSVMALWKRDAFVFTQFRPTSNSKELQVKKLP